MRAPIDHLIFFEDRDQLRFTISHQFDLINLRTCSTPIWFISWRIVHVQHLARKLPSPLIDRSKSTSSFLSTFALSSLSQNVFLVSERHEIFHTISHNREISRNNIFPFLSSWFHAEKYTSQLTGKDGPWFIPITPLLTVFSSTRDSFPRVFNSRIFAFNVSERYLCFARIDQLCFTPVILSLSGSFWWFLEILRKVKSWTNCTQNATHPARKLLSESVSFIVLCAQFVIPLSTYRILQIPSSESIAYRIHSVDDNQSSDWLIDHSRVREREIKVGTVTEITRRIPLSSTRTLTGEGTTATKNVHTWKCVLPELEWSQNNPPSYRYHLSILPDPPYLRCSAWPKSSRRRRRRAHEDAVPNSSADRHARRKMWVR